MTKIEATDDAIEFVEKHGIKWNYFKELLEKYFSDAKTIYAEYTLSRTGACIVEVACYFKVEPPNTVNVGELFPRELFTEELKNHDATSELWRKMFIYNAVCVKEEK